MAKVPPMSATISNKLPRIYHSLSGPCPPRQLPVRARESDFMRHPVATEIACDRSPYISSLPGTHPRQLHLETGRRARDERLRRIAVRGTGGDPDAEVAVGREGGGERLGVYARKRVGHAFERDREHGLVAGAAR